MRIREGESTPVCAGGVRVLTALVEAARRKAVVRRDGRSEGLDATGGMERAAGIEPTSPGWKPGVLPLNYTREIWLAAAVGSRMPSAPLLKGNGRVQQTFSPEMLCWRMTTMASGQKRPQFRGDRSS